MVQISGPPAISFYNMLSGIGDTLQQNAKLSREQALRDAFKNGLPKTPDGSIDFGATGNILSQNGADLPTLLTVAKLAEDQHKNALEVNAARQFQGMLGGILGGGSAAPASPATATAAPLSTPNTSVVPPARPEVMPSPTVWGDKEAEDAGLYEKPATGLSYGDAMRGKGPLISATPTPPAPSPAPTQPPAGSGFQGIGIQHAPALISALANPYLPPGQKALAQTLLTRALDDAKEPDKVRTLNAIKEQSNYPGTILDLERDLRAASKPDTTVNIDQKAETAEAGAAGKAAGERRAAMFAAANKATDNLANLTRVQTLLDQVDQGKLQPQRMTISAWAKSLGVNDDFAKSLGLDPSKVGDAQALQAMTNELVLGKIGAGGLPANNFSDADRQFLTDTLPKLGNDPRANKILIEAARRVQNANLQRALDYQQWKSDPANKNRSFEDFELSKAQTTSQMDRFGDLQKQAQSLLPQDSGGQSGNAGGIDWRVK